MEVKKRSTLTIVLFAVYMLLLAGVILFKLPFYSPAIADGVRVINLIPLAGSYNEGGRLMIGEIIPNILIFVPFGIYLSMLKNQWPFWKKILTMASLSLAFEGIQFIFAIGRSDITDLINNTLGGLIGIGAYALLSKIFKHKTAKVVNILALAATVCTVARFCQLLYLSHFAMRP